MSEWQEIESDPIVDRDCLFSAWVVFGSLTLAAVMLTSSFVRSAVLTGPLPSAGEVSNVAR
jgi:hypothetical protein